MSAANIVDARGLLVPARYTLGERLGAGASGETFAAVDTTDGARVRGQGVRRRATRRGARRSPSSRGCRRWRTRASCACATSGASTTGGCSGHRARRGRRRRQHRQPGRRGGAPRGPAAGGARAGRRAGAPARRAGIVHGDVCPANVRLAGGRARRADRLRSRGAAAAGRRRRARHAGLRGARGADRACAPPPSICSRWARRCTKRGAARRRSGAVCRAVQRMLSEPAPVLSSIRPGLGEGWDQLFARLLAADPGGGPASARELLREVICAVGAAPTRRPRSISASPIPEGDPLAGIFVGRRAERAALRAAPGPAGGRRGAGVDAGAGRRARVGTAGAVRRRRARPRGRGRRRRDAGDRDLARRRRRAGAVAGGGRRRRPARPPASMPSAPRRRALAATGRGAGGPRARTSAVRLAGRRSRGRRVRDLGGRARRRRGGCWWSCAARARAARGRSPRRSRWRRWRAADVAALLAGAGDVAVPERERARGGVDRDGRAGKRRGRRRAGAPSDREPARRARGADARRRRGGRRSRRAARAMATARCRPTRRRWCSRWRSPATPAPRRSRALDEERCGARRRARRAGGWSVGRRRPPRCPARRTGARRWPRRMRRCGTRLAARALAVLARDDRAPRRRAGGGRAARPRRRRCCATPRPRRAATARPRAAALLYERAAALAPGVLDAAPNAWRWRPGSACWAATRRRRAPSWRAAEPQATARRPAPRAPSATPGCARGAAIRRARADAGTRPGDGDADGAGAELRARLGRLLVTIGRLQRGAGGRRAQPATAAARRRCAR